MAVLPIFPREKRAKRDSCTFICVTACPRNYIDDYFLLDVLFLLLNRVCLVLNFLFLSAFESNVPLG